MADPAEPLTLPPTPAAEAAAALRQAGAVAVENVWPRETMEALRRAVYAAYPEFGQSGMVSEKAKTGPGRFYAPVAIDAAILEAGLFDAPELDGLLREALEPGYVIEAFGMLMAEPGAPAQQVHRDGGPLFAASGLDRLLPASALTVAIPLVDVVAENSRTAVIPGTHRALETFPTGQSYAPDLPLGSFFAWDYRTGHYGTAHRGTEQWPLLYMAPCRPFWTDNLNFNRGNRPLLARESAASRLDARFVRAAVVPD